MYDPASLNLPRMKSLPTLDPDSASEPDPNLHREDVPVLATTYAPLPAVLSMCTSESPLVALILAVALALLIVKSPVRVVVPVTLRVVPT
jgi:hypothetical protein